MPINIPSTTTATLGTIEVLENDSTVHYQQFVLTDPEGNPLGSSAAPVPITVTMSGYLRYVNEESTVVPVGGAFYFEDLYNTGSELVTGELSVQRLTQKGGLKTAGDGRVNEVVSAVGSGYDDIYVTESTFAAENLISLTVSGEFFDTLRSAERFVYIPMIRSGWRKMSFSFKTAASGVLKIYTDLGSLTADILVDSFDLQSGIRYGFIPEDVPVSGALRSVPALSSFCNGVIISFSPGESTAGLLELHITRGG
jgi:hypothetical protein